MQYHLPKNLQDRQNDPMRRAHRGLSKLVAAQHIQRRYDKFLALCSQENSGAYASLLQSSYLSVFKLAKRRPASPQ